MYYYTISVIHSKHTLNIYPEQNIMEGAQEQQEIPEHYLEAQRAAVEAVEIGRGTLEATNRQGEQLTNASRLADQTKYALDQSSRLLRGMTWTGWVQNIFTPDVKGPNSSSSSLGGKPISVDEVPPFAKTAAQSIQNYRANLTVLEACETMEQRHTCQVICNNMFEVAASEVNQLQADNNPTVVQQLSQELSKLHRHQNEVLQRQFQQQQQQLETRTIVNPTKTKASQVQDDHLDFLANNLGELNMMASTLNEQMTQQNQIMESLDDKAEEIHEQTRAVTRKTDRMTQKKSWTPPKKVFEKWISVKHIESGKYLSSELNGKLVLVDTFHPEKCVYGVWMRKSGLFGLKNKFSNRFLGQTLLGSLSCAASNFGQREEWQADHDWESSKLLIASAGWGNGGYLKVRLRDFVIQIVDKTKADSWCLAEVQSDLG